MAGSNGMVALQTTFSTAGGVACGMWPGSESPSGGGDGLEEPVPCSSHITPYVKTSQGENWGPAWSSAGPPEPTETRIEEGGGDLQVSKCMSNKSHNLENMLGMKENAR